MFRYIRVIIFVISFGLRMRGGILLRFVVLSVRRVLLVVVICSSSLGSGGGLSGLGFVGFVMLFDCIFRYFDNFIFLLLFFVSMLRKGSVDRCERSKYGFI